MFKLFRLFNVPVRMHWTFLLLAIWIGSSLGVIPTLLLLGCVLAHEFGHVLVARKYGYYTHDVTAMGLGMVANIGGDIKKGELLIAAAGPAVNFVLAGLLYALNGVLAHILYPELDMLSALNVYNTINIVMVGNIVLGLFNLLPLFPLDGGRIVRAVLAKFCKTRIKATKVAAIIGTIVACALMPLAVMSGDIVFIIILPLVVFFSWSEVKRLRETGIEPKIY